MKPAKVLGAGDIKRFLGPNAVMPTVECPGCGKRIVRSSLNKHLDTECSSSPVPIKGSDICKGKDEDDDDFVEVVQVFLKKKEGGRTAAGGKVVSPPWTALNRKCTVNGSSEPTASSGSSKSKQESGVKSLPKARDSSSCGRKAPGSNVISPECSDSKGMKKRRSEAAEETPRKKARICAAAKELLTPPNSRESPEEIRIISVSPKIKGRPGRFGLVGSAQKKKVGLPRSVSCPQFVSSNGEAVDPVSSSNLLNTQTSTSFSASASVRFPWSSKGRGKGDRDTPVGGFRRNLFGKAEISNKSIASKESGKVTVASKLPTEAGKNFFKRRSEPPVKNETTTGLSADVEAPSKASVQNADDAVTPAVAGPSTYSLLTLERKSSEKDGRKLSEKDGRKLSEKDGRKSSEKDGGKSSEKDGRKSSEKDGGKSSEKDGRKSSEKDGGKSSEKEGRKSSEKDERKSLEHAVTPPLSPSSPNRTFVPYYLKNFTEILHRVIRDPLNAHLLDDRDVLFWTAFQGMSQNGQQLFVRLFQRKSGWLRRTKIKYDEETPVELLQGPVMDELIESSLLQAGPDTPDTSLEDILALLQLGEIKSLAKKLQLSTVGFNKEGITMAILRLSKQQSSQTFFSSKSTSDVIRSKALDLVGSCIRVNEEARRLFLALFTLFHPPDFSQTDPAQSNQSPAMTTLMFVSRGDLAYPQVHIVRSRKIYQTRKELHDFYDAQELVTKMTEVLLKKDWQRSDALYAVCRHKYCCLPTEYLDHASSLPPHLRRLTVGSALVFALSLCAEAFEKQRKYLEAAEEYEVLLAQELFMLDCRGHWMDRLALIVHQHLKKPQDALVKIAEALKWPQIRGGHRLSLCLRARKLLKKFGQGLIAEEELLNPVEAPTVKIQARSLPRDIPGMKLVYLTETPGNAGDMHACSVEEVALAHYAKEGFPEGIHGEGSTVGSLFGFLFWDLIYPSEATKAFEDSLDFPDSKPNSKPPPDTFVFPFQAVPLDLNHLAFYGNRKEEMDTRLKRLCDWGEAEVQSQVRTVWTREHGKQSLIYWDRFRSPDQVVRIIESLGLRIVSGICERLIKDHRFTRSGLPDLLVWNSLTKRHKFVEVKGPNDRLSPKQILWLDYLLSIGCSAEVCHVEVLGGRRKAILLN